MNNKLYLLSILSTIVHTQCYDTLLKTVQDAASFTDVSSTAYFVRGYTYSYDISLDSTH